MAGWLPALTVSVDPLKGDCAGLKLLVPLKLHWYLYLPGAGGVRAVPCPPLFSDKLLSVNVCGPIKVMVYVASCQSTVGPLEADMMKVTGAFAARVTDKLTIHSTVRVYFCTVKVIGALSSVSFNGTLK